MRFILLQETGFVVLAFAIALILGLDLLGQIRLTREAVFWGLVAALPTVAMNGATLLVKNGTLRRMSEQPLRFYGRILAGLSLPWLMLIALVSGIAEELLFRGALLEAGLLVMDPWAAVLAVGLVFGLMHLITVANAVIVGLVGIYWGFVYLAADNLLVPMIAHVLTNMAAFIALDRLWRRDGPL